MHLLQSALQLCIGFYTHSYPQHVHCIRSRCIMSINTVNRKQNCFTFAQSKFASNHDYSLNASLLLLLEIKLPCPVVMLGQCLAETWNRHRLVMWQAATVETHGNPLTLLDRVRYCYINSVCRSVCLLSRALFVGCRRALPLHDVADPQWSPKNGWGSIIISLIPGVSIAIYRWRRMRRGQF